jgi:hypothetical protein
MQSLNDDMDELFRRASEEYPLNTDGSDWNKVLHELQHKKSHVPKGDKNKTDFRFLWLLLLLPAGFICGRYMGNNKNDKAIAVEQNLVPANVAGGKVKENVPVAAGNDEGVAAGVTKNTGAKKQDSPILPGTAAAKNTSSYAPFVVGSIPKIGRKNRGNGISRNATKNQLINKSTQSLDALKEIPDAVASVNNTNSSAPAADAAQNSVSAETAIQQDSSKTDDTRDVLKEPAAHSKESKKKQPPFKGMLSYSLIVGPDISTVKFHKASSVGYSAGVAVRYQFVKNVSIEAGLLWTRKSYYSEGKYVDTSRLKLPVHSMVKNASGYCNMIDIPINVRYDFVSTPNHTWFVTAGLSSYLMKNEDYSISYDRYNQPYVKNYEYVNSTKDWFSIVNVSAGFQKVVGKSIQLSIAPYIKLPLQGVGIGKLPVSSTGIFFSVSRSSR